MSIRPNRSPAAAWTQQSRRPETADPYDGSAPGTVVRRFTLVPSEPEPKLSAGRDPRHGGQSQDQALYSCPCGFRFEALVSTSVGCPRCGGTQAW